MAAAHETFGPQTQHEKSARDLHRDTRPWFQRLSQALRNGTAAGALLGLCAAGVALVPGTVEAEGATGTEPGSRSGVAPAPEDHAFSDMLRQAARERDVPLAAFSDPGVVVFADRELANALVTIERAGGQNARQAKLAVRQLLAERDRVLREPVAMRLPPVAPEKLDGVIRSLIALLEQGAAAAIGSTQTASLTAQTEPARLGAAGPE